MSAEKSKTNDKFSKYISVILVVVIIFAICVLVYTNLVEKEPGNSDIVQPPLEEHEDNVLTLSVDSTSYNYSLNELMTFDSISGKGLYINKVGKINGPNNYTGVSMVVLLDAVESIPYNYTIQAIASDGYSINYTMDEVKGKVLVYNETGVEIGTKNLTMIVAYKENGEFLNETTSGPLRIAFIDEQGQITNSGMWLRSIVKIEIV